MKKTEHDGDGLTKCPDKNDPDLPSLSMWDLQNQANPKPEMVLVFSFIGSR